MKYKPFKKYLVSSLEIANLVFSIKLSNSWESILSSDFKLSTSIIGNSSLGKHPKENLDLPDLIEKILPSLEINSISLSSDNFLIMSY